MGFFFLFFFPLQRTLFRQKLRTPYETCLLFFLLELQGKSLDWTEIREKGLQVQALFGGATKEVQFTQPQVSTMCGMKKKVLIDNRVHVH
jgi:hypothetical protein